MAARPQFTPGINGCVYTRMHLVAKCGTQPEPARILQNAAHERRNGTFVVARIGSGCSGAQITAFTDNAVANIIPVR